MRIVAIIPSRYGSSRFDGKPLALIAGVPMIQRVVESASRAETVETVVVATDDRRIADAVTAFGGQVVMTAVENRSGTDRVAEAAAAVGLAADDVVINIQGDQPLLDPRCLDALIAPFIKETGRVHMATLAYRIVRECEITDPKDVKVVFDAHYNALYFSRAPIPLSRDGGRDHDTYKHLGVYAYTVAYLQEFRQLPSGRIESIEKLEQLRALEYGHDIRIVVTPYDSPEVDLPEDIPRIEALLSTFSH
ncbi:MAG: 3-deoxy-manno-octulosonate cytidylyltransferase [Pseudomonadota bacterium]